LAKIQKIYIFSCYFVTLIKPFESQSIAPKKEHQSTHPLRTYLKIAMWQQHNGQQAREVPGNK